VVKVRGLSPLTLTTEWVTPTPDRKWSGVTLPPPPPHGVNYQTVLSADARCKHGESVTFNTLLSIRSGVSHVHKRHLVENARLLPCIGNILSTWNC